MYKAIVFILNFLIVSTLSFDMRRVNVKIDYNKTKAIVQYCLNSLVNLLNVEVPASRVPKLRLLVVMQNNLNNIEHYKWKVQSEMQYVSRADSIATPSKLYEYVEAAITDIEKDNPSNKTTIPNKATNDSSNFFAEIFNAINNQNVTVDNVHYINDTNIENQEMKMNRRIMDDDLEVWEPDEDVEINARKVFGGKPVAITQYPFIVSIHVFGKFKGTGCIINKNFVITTASCLQPSTTYRGEQSPIQVRLGSEQISTGGDVLPAVAVIFHPKYDSVTLENNLAIIKVKNILHSVKRPLIKKVRIGSLPDHMPKNFASKGVFVLGWVPEEITRTSLLSSAFLDMTSLDECMNVYTTHLVKGKHFCAELHYKGAGTCNGDIGSPAIVLGTLVGLVNFGPAVCGAKSTPTVFTKLAYYTPWISEVLKKDAQNSNHKLDSIFAFEATKNDFAVSKESPEEMLILRQLIHEVEKPNNKIDEIIEDAELKDEMDVLFKTPSTTTSQQLPGFEKHNENSITIKGAYGHFNINPYVTKAVDTDREFGDTVRNNKEIRYFIQDFMTDETDNFPDEVKKYLKLLNFRSIPQNKREKKSVESDSNDNFEYDTDEGLSIEVKKKGNDGRDKLRKGQSSKKSRVQDTVLDLGDHNVKLEMRSNKRKPFIKQPDIWSEVMRMNKIKPIRLGQSYFGNGRLTLNRPIKSKRFPSIVIT